MRVFISFLHLFEYAELSLWSLSLSSSSLPFVDVVVACWSLLLQIHNSIFPIYILIFISIFFGVGRERICWSLSPLDSHRLIVLHSSSETVFVRICIQNLLKAPIIRFFSSFLICLFPQNVWFSHPFFSLMLQNSQLQIQTISMTVRIKLGMRENEAIKRARERDAKANSEWEKKRKEGRDGKT